MAELKLPLFQRFAIDRTKFPANRNHLVPCAQIVICTHKIFVYPTLGICANSCASECFGLFGRGFLRFSYFIGIDLRFIDVSKPLFRERQVFLFQQFFYLPVRRPHSRSFDSSDCRFHNCCLSLMAKLSLFLCRNPVFQR